MQFHIAQTNFFRTPLFPIQGVPMNNLAPMKNCPGGGRGGGKVTLIGCRGNTVCDENSWSARLCFLTVTPFYELITEVVLLTCYLRGCNILWYTQNAPDHTIFIKFSRGACPRPSSTSVIQHHNRANYAPGI